MNESGYKFYYLKQINKLKTEERNKNTEIDKISFIVLSEILEHIIKMYIIIVGAGCLPAILGVPASWPYDAEGLWFGSEPNRN